MTASHQVDQCGELKEIDDPIDPAWPGAKSVVGVFSISLREQYEDMVYSVHHAREADKQRKRLRSGEKVPYPSIMPHALIVWNLTTAEVSTACRTIHYTDAR